MMVEKNKKILSVRHKFTCIDFWYFHSLIMQLTEYSFRYACEKSEEEIHHAYLQNFIDQTLGSVFLLEPNLCVIGQNTAAKRWVKKYISSKKKQFKIYNPVTIFDYMQQQHFQVLNNAFKKVLKGQICHKQMLEWPVTSDSNKKYFFEITIFPWLNSKGIVTNILFFFEEVTKQHDAALFHERLKKISEELQNFNLILAHDFLQPVRQIANFLELLKTYYYDLKIQHPFVERAFYSMENSISYIRKLTEGMLNYCAQGNLQFASETIEIEHLVLQVIQSNLKAFRNRFDVKIDPGIKVCANYVVLMQLFQNLLINAVKYSDESTPITLLIEKGVRRIHFYLHNYGHVNQRIRKKNIFKPFVSSSENGSGLGMMLCKKIVQAYRGKIVFKSTKKRGTVIQFTLPLPRQNVRKKRL